MLRLVIFSTMFALPMLVKADAPPSPYASIQTEIDGFVHCSLQKADDIADGQSAPEDIADVATRSCNAQFSILRDAFSVLIKENAGDDITVEGVSQAATSAVSKISISTRNAIIRLISTGKIAPSTEDKPVPKVQTLGNSQEAAIEVCKASGESIFLDRLVCDAGEHPIFERLGSVGSRNPQPTDQTKAQAEKMLLDNLTGRALQPGAIDYHTVDQYEVSCNNYKARIYLDMYHCDAKNKAVAPIGFTIFP